MRSLVIVAMLLAGSEARAEQPKSLAEAYLVTVGATTGPIAAFTLMAGDDTGAVGTVGGMFAITALVVGPSAGHFYAGRRWTTGLTLRLTSVGMLGGLVALGAADKLDLGTAIVGGIASFAVFEVGMVWDLVTLPRAIRRANRERALAIAPFASSQSAGFALSGQW